MADRKIRGQRKNLDFDFVKKLRLEKILKESSLKIKKGTFEIMESEPISWKVRSDQKSPLDHQKLTTILIFKKHPLIKNHSNPHLNHSTRLNRAIIRDIYAHYDSHSLKIP